jgi:cytochrome b561
MVLLHWLMAVVILGMIACGWYMSELEGEDPLRPLLYDLHKAFGVTAFVLVVIRLLVRFTSRKPALPNSFRPLEVKAAATGHALLYVLMIAVPLSGYAMSTLFGFSVKWFGLELPKLLPVDRLLARDVKEMHELFAYSLLAVIAIHVAAVIKHYLFEKVNLLSRMKW